ncbi:MAG: hypothetical protein LDL33_09595 [Desulfomonile sp.]|nr:hypothetical protein [Desulfomonile sp.]
MKPRSHTLSLMFIVVASVVLAVGSDATAEQSGLPYPVITPGINSIYRGPHWFDAGIMYMSLDTVKVVVNPYSNPGSTESFNESRHSFGSDVWAPVFEVGRQANNYFDLYAGFSWFSLSDGKGFFQISQNNPAVTQNIAYRLDVDGYRFAVGGRSWFPMWGLGRIATSLGMVQALLPYKVSATRTITGEGSRSDSKNSLWWYVAGAIGVDMEIGYRSFFGKAQVGYNFGTQHKYQLVDIVTHVNPTSLTVALSGGLRF